MEDQIRQHPVWGTLQQLATLRGDKAFVENAGDPQISWSAQRIFQFSDLVSIRLRRAPTTILSPPTLAQLQSVLSTVAAEVTSYTANRNVGHLANALSQIDSQGFTFLAAVPFGVPEESAVSLGEITDNLRNQTLGVLKALADDRDRLAQELVALRSATAQQLAQVNELTVAVSTQKAEATTTVQALQTTYAAKEQEFSKTFEVASAKRAEEHSNLIASLSADADLTSKNLTLKVDSLISDISAKRDEARKIVRIVGNIGVTGNYQETAAIERTSANRWRLITLGAFVAAGATGALTLFAAHEVGVPLTIARMLFSFLVLAITVYTGRESARHRSNADRAKRVELELASLGPFIESLPPEQQNQLRSKLTEQYFGKEGDPHSVKPVIEPDQVVDLLKTAIGQLRR